MLIEAKPYDYRLNLASAALPVIDMQRDLLEFGGSREMLGDNISPLRCHQASARGRLRSLQPQT